MRLSEIINRRRSNSGAAFLPVSVSPFATATVATVATLRQEECPTVVSVATVANPFSDNEGENLPTVASVATVAVASPFADVTSRPAIIQTHRTTCDLIFNDPETGTVRTIPAGTHCRRFASPTSALMAGVHLDYMGEWAANKNIERGYSLIWLDGMLRGVHFSDIEPLKGIPND